MASNGKALSAIALASILISSGTGIAGEKLRGNKKSLPKAVKNTDFYDNGRPDPLEVELGKLLFHDKILSGNRNISCATCHHALTDTGDGLSLPVGEGGRGLGVTRTTGSKGNAIHERVPRNAPHVFNLGAKQFKKMFDDGRVQVDSSEPSGFRSPAGRDLPRGLDNVLAAQAMFPVTSPTEMAGQDGENNVARAAVAGDVVEVWRLLGARLRRIGGYVDLFVAVYDDVETAADITYVHAANAIATFEAFAWRADGSPFDRYLRGEKGAMSAKAKQGMKLFYGKAGCSDCHSGKFQTDQRFHAIAMPQIGPGKGNGAGGREDFGRENVTLRESDRYKFRTPTLRNVALTGPWGHAGAYDTLRAMVDHNIDPVNSLHQYDPSQAVMPSRPDLDELDFQVLNDSAAMTAIGDACELESVALSENQIGLLMDFLHALTDPSSVDLRVDVPSSVPSGLTLAE